MKTLPFLPFDPREVGPFELAKAKLSGIKRVSEDNAPYLIIATVVLVALGLHYGVSIPRPPNVLILVAIATVVATLVGYPVGIKIGRGLDETETILLSEQNPINGSQRLLRLAPHRFEDMEVENHNGETRSQSFLKTVVINGEKAYEVDSYDTETNTAIASWQAGASNSSIRADRNQIKRIKTSLEEEADKALELLTSHPEILRKQATEVSMEIIRVAEEVEVPGGGQLHEELSASLDEADPSEELLDSAVQFDEDGDKAPEDGNVDLSQEEEYESIMDRARAMADGGEEQ